MTRSGGRGGGVASAKEEGEEEEWERYRDTMRPLQVLWCSKRDRKGYVAVGVSAVKLVKFLSNTVNMMHTPIH